MSIGLLAPMLMVPAARAQYYNVGVQYFMKKDYKKALPYLIQSIKTDGVDANVLYYIALSYHYLKDYDNSKRYFQRILNEYPSTPPAKMALQMLGPNAVATPTHGAVTTGKPVAPAARPVTATQAGAPAATGAGTLTSTGTATGTSTGTGASTGTATGTADPNVSRGSVIHTYGAPNSSSPGKKGKGR
jgi:tetratricopeptide (TPR) repeat protein